MPSMPPDAARRSLHALPLGTVLHDYVIDSELGSGGFSIVYLARHRLNADWLFAVKEYYPRELVARDTDGASVHPVNTESEDAFEDGLRRFRDEADQLRRFRNEPHIVSCLNYFEANGTAYLVMDYDDGLPLSEFLRRREAAGQPFTEADLRAVIEPLLEGLGVVHRAGVLHRDIKPGNIFVRQPDNISGRPAQPVLIDFGAARQNYLARHSQSQAPYTPGYAAYEQISSEGDIGPWTDIYAIGALMWRMVAGGCAGDSRLHLPDDTTSDAVWNPTPRAVEKRSYALHSGKPDPMVSAAELGASRFSPRLLAAVDACLTLVPDKRVQYCEQLTALIEGSESPVFEDNDNAVQLTARTEPAAASTPGSLHGGNEISFHSAVGAGRLNAAYCYWHTLAERFARRERWRRAGSNRSEVRRSADISRESGSIAKPWSIPGRKTLWVAALTLVTISVLSSTFVSVPFASNGDAPIWQGNVAGATLRQHNLFLNLATFVGEQFVFDDDPQFDRDELLAALVADQIRATSVSTIQELARARSLAEYEYLRRKQVQRGWDQRMLEDQRMAEEYVASAFVRIPLIVLDPMIFLPAWVLCALALRGGRLASRRGMLWGIGVGAVVSGSALAAQHGVMFAFGGGTLDAGLPASAVAVVLCGLAFGAVGAIASRRQQKDIADKQNASIRAGALCGLCAPLLQLLISRTGVASDLEGAETLALVFVTFFVVAIYYWVLGSITYFANRKQWIIWIFSLGVLLAFDVALGNYRSVPYWLEFPVVTLFVVPLFWIPSAVGLEILYRRIDNIDISILWKTTLYAAFIFLVGYGTYIVLSDLFGFRG